MLAIVRHLLVITGLVLATGVGAAAYGYHAWQVAPRGAEAGPTALPAGAVPIPAQSDWIDYGMVIDASPFGAGWDALFEGTTPASLVKKDGVYYLYYVGADDYISQKDNVGPAHRSIGVATSTDGVNWSKYSGNPVITFTASGNPEEGAVSAGVFVDSSGTFHAYYGSNVSDSPTSNRVTADVRLATSHDGFVFRDQGVVLGYSDPGVWGHGDELHSVMAFQQDGIWYSYYIPNGVPQRGKLGFASGPAPTSLTTSGPVTGEGSEVGARGAGSIVPVDPAMVAFFLNSGGTTEVRLASPGDLQRLGPALVKYSWDDGSRVVFLDRSRRTWFMIYDRWSHMGLRLAPAGERDDTSPSAPLGLTAGPIGSGSIELTWDAATDADTGVVQYNLYRDGARLTSTMHLSYRDNSNLAELTPLVYEVRAVNLHGVEGPGTELTTTAPPDTVAPAIESVETVGPDRLRLAFSEPVERSSAETVSNYAISHGMEVIGATLDDGSRTVTLTTTNHSSGVAYSLAAVGIRDLAVAPNESDVKVLYTYGEIPGLVGYWRPGVGGTQLFEDISGRGSHGVARGSPSLSTDRGGAAIELDGTDDYIEIERTGFLDSALSHSFSLSLWAKPTGRPADTTSSNGAYTMMAGPNLLVQYDHRRSISVQTTTGGGDVRVSSGPLDSDRWYHLAMVVDDESKQLHLYVDGQSVADSPKSYEGDLQPLPRPAIGVMDDYYARYRIGVRDPLFDYKKDYFQGVLGEVQLFNRPLSHAEVARLYGE